MHTLKIVRRRSFRRLVMFSAASLMLPALAHAQAPRPRADLPGPTLVAYANGTHSEANKREISVSALDIQVEVRGDIAETMVTAVFNNPSSDMLEGQFALNMPSGAVVTGYALDINGTLIDGVLETKYKAAEAYQRRVNRRIDPGLAEVDYSDRFETRIYPVPPRGSRTVRLRMVSAFDPGEGYVLPLNMPGKVGRVSLSVEGDAKIVSLPGLAGGARIEGENVQLKGALKLAAKERPEVMLVSEHPGAERFFDIEAPAPRGDAAGRAPLHIFWDRSVSRTDDELKAEAQIAEDLAVKRGLLRVKVTLFDSGKVETLDVDAGRLSEELGKVRYRGGTSYAVLSQVPVKAGSDCVMFSDGRVSIDDRRNFSLPCRVFTVSSGPESDRAWLGDLSEKSGGVSVNLTGMKAEDALKQLQRPEAGIASVTDGSGKPIETVRLAADARMIHIVGPLPNDGVVQLTMAGETSPRRFTAPGRADIFAGPGALWASHRLGVVASDLPPDDLARMARRYNVATPQASFVVLETPQDYVQSNIEPPESYPKALRQQYVSLRTAADTQKSRERESRLEQVVGLWEQQKKWWNTRFKGIKTSRDQKVAEGDRRELALESPRPAAPTAAPPSPPPPPPANARANGSGARDSVVVTGQLRAGAVQDAALAVSTVTAEERKDEAEPAATESIGGKGKIEVAEWQVDRPYLKRLDKAGKDWEAQLDKEIKDNGALPLFWFDVAEWHWRGGRKEEARRAAEAALDLPTRDNQTLAIVAARLVRYGSYDRAIWLYERLAEREADRPQPKRTLALALIQRSKAAESQAAERADLQRAIALLNEAATVNYDVNAVGVETVSLMEANAALARLKAIGGTSDALDKRLVANLDTDVRVVMEWNTPRTDLDLWVTEPKEEKVGYSSPASSWGGKLSGDVTNGYGPEEYLIHAAQKGVYEIRANTFASDRANPNGPSTLSVRVIRNFGRPNQSEELIDVEMGAESRDMRLLGKITIE